MLAVEDTKFWSQISTNISNATKGHKPQKVKLWLPAKKRVLSKSANKTSWDNGKQEQIELQITKCTAFQPRNNWKPHKS